MTALDWLADGTRDAYLLRALGLIAAGGFLLLWAGLRLMPPKIGV